MLNVISLGAGVQSTAMALMATHGEIRPMPDAAVFADTQSDPGPTYQHLRWLTTRLAFPVHTTTAGSLKNVLLGRAKAGSHARPPLFIKNPDGSAGMIRRQCTGDFKIDPIEKKLRELLGLRPRQWWPKAPVVAQWIGITTDEASRMKPSPRPAISTRWPLIEAGLSRRDCEAWLTRNGYPIPPKSACTFCPFRSDAEWRWLRDNDPDGWADAVAVDAAVRDGLTTKTLTGTLYVHRSLKPLAEVDLSTAEERGQLNMFENECQGMCGV